MKRQGYLYQTKKYKVCGVSVLRPDSKKIQGITMDVELGDGRTLCLCGRRCVNH